MVHDPSRIWVVVTQVVNVQHSAGPLGSDHPVSLVVTRTTRLTARPGLGCC